MHRDTKITRDLKVENDDLKNKVKHLDSCVDTLQNQIDTWYNEDYERERRRRRLDSMVVATLLFKSNFLPDSILETVISQAQDLIDEIDDRIKA